MKRQIITVVLLLGLLATSGCVTLDQVKTAAKYTAISIGSAAAGWAFSELTQDDDGGGVKVIGNNNTTITTYEGDTDFRPTENPTAP